MVKFDNNAQINLTAKNLRCDRDGQTIFEQIDFELATGQALFLRGPNGAGKSTLLLVLAGLLPFGGDVDFGRSTKQLEQAPTSELIHFISLANAMKSQLTLDENLRFWCHMSGGDISTIPNALEKSGLGGLGNFAAGHLSTGQTHRLSLARLLICPRPIWLLDEPSSALDGQGDQWVASLIDEHLLNGGLVVAATHRKIELTHQNNAKTLTLGATN